MQVQIINKNKLIYIVSKDPIKLNDWCFERNTLFQVKEINTISGICRDNIGNPFVTDACLNVIASNDNTINVYNIPNDFILNYDGKSYADVEYMNVVAQSNGLRSDGFIIDEIVLPSDVNFLKMLSVPKLNYKDNTIYIS
jgi:hypothetical protein